MHCYFVAEPRAVGLQTLEEERAFQRVDNMFKAAILSMLGDTIVRDENGMDIFRPYSRPNPFRGVLIRPYPSPNI
jgi:hypothetical protein